MNQLRLNTPLFAPAMVITAVLSSGQWTKDKKNSNFCVCKKFFSGWLEYKSYK